MERKKRNVWRLIPVSPYDAAGLEVWLSEMAGQGLFLIKTGYYFASFQRREAKNMVYQLVPCDLYHDDFVQEVKAQYEMAGWEESGTVSRKFLAFSSGRETAGTPELSEEIRSAGVSYLKKTGYNCLVTAVLNGVLIAVWNWIILGRYGFWYTAARLTPLILVALMVFCFGLNICFQLSDYFQIRKISKKAGKRRDPVHVGRGRKRSVRAAVIIMGLGLVFIWATERNSWHKDLDEVNISLPAPPLTAIDRGSRLTEGTVSASSSIIAPVQYEVVQNGDSGQMLRMDYVKLRFPWMGKPFLESMMAEKLEWSDAVPVKTDSKLFDVVYEAEITDTMHYLFVMDGEEIAAVCYIGPGYSGDFLESIHDAMEMWTQPEAY